MEEFLKQILGHGDLGVHVIGWLIAAVIALFTLLYKGIWKAFNIIRTNQEDMQSDLDRLIGEHMARHNIGSWDGTDRRRDKR